MPVSDDTTVLERARICRQRQSKPSCVCHQYASNGYFPPRKPPVTAFAHFSMGLSLSYDGSSPVHHHTPPHQVLAATSCYPTTTDCWERLLH